jgi:hypothetical protein
LYLGIPVVIILGIRKKFNDFTKNQVVKLKNFD